MPLSIHNKKKLLKKIQTKPKQLKRKPIDSELDSS